MSVSDRRRQTLIKFISPYFPSGAIGQVTEWIITYHIQLTITGKRENRYGDYRPAPFHKPQRISINKNLTPSCFLVVFVHELAHLTCRIKYNGGILTHGPEWQKEMKELMMPFMNERFFSAETLANINPYLTDVSNGSLLIRILSAYDMKNRRV